MAVSNLDDSSAMRKIAGSSEKALVPSFYLLDRQGRIRLKKGGFTYASLRKGSGRRAKVEIRESVLTGAERIRDYIDRLLDEG